MQTMLVCWRKVCATLPAVLLIGGGITLSAHAEPISEVAFSKDAPAIVVPDVAMEPPSTLSTLSAPGTTSALPAPAPTSTDPLAVPAPLTPALVLPAGTVPGSSTPVTLDNDGIPTRALESYRSAVALVNTADPDCNIDWALVAAIGRVESDHARFGGNQLDPAGVAQPGIIGIPLDGSNGTARIMDTDRGLLDRDTVYDRAVGPMQFIPGTWAGAGADADGDGAKNPQDMTDAAAAAAIYLCSGPGDLGQPADLDAAIMRYNASDSYVRTVIAIAEAYRQGVTELPASDLPASNPPASAQTVADPTVADPPAADISAADRSAPTMALSAKMPAGQPSPTTLPGSRSVGGAAVTPITIPPMAAAPASPVLVTPPATPVPATQVPVTPPATPVPVTPPATQVPVTPVPVTPVPVTPVPVTPAPVTPVPVPEPDPCLVVTDPTAPAPTPAPVPTPLTPCLTPTPAPTP